MVTFLTVVHVICAILLVLLVLVQSGKGAEISASFGGSSQTVFGSSGGANFFTRFTAAVAGVFMVTSMSLTVLGNANRKSLFEGAHAVPAQSAPAPATPGNPAAPGQPAPAAPAKPATTH